MVPGKHKPKNLMQLYGKTVPPTHPLISVHEYVSNQCDDQNAEAESSGRTFSSCGDGLKDAADVMPVDEQPNKIIAVIRTECAAGNHDIFSAHERFHLYVTDPD